MSSAHIVSPLLQAGRRFHARRRIDGLAYVEFGPENGAILIDVGEGGLGFQSVMPVTMDQALLFKFKLPTKSTHVEGFAEVAWVNESGKGGGLRFVELDADACTQIREWTGVLSAPEGRAVRAGNIDSNPAEERATEEAPALPVQTSTISETNGEATAQIEDILARAETAQIAAVNLESNPPSSADTSDDSDEAGSKELPVHQDALPEASAIPEFTIEVAAASDAALTPITQVPWSTAVAAASSEVMKSPQPRSSNRSSDVLKAVGTSETILSAAAAPATSARMPASSEKTFVPAQKIPQRQTSLRPESHPAAAYRQDTALPASLVRQPQGPVPPLAPWKNMPASDDELQPKAKLASQALKIGIGAAAGACLVLLLVATVPSLRTRVQVNANAKAGGAILPGASAFQIEVADLNNRRWILRSGGDVGSPFSDAPSRRDTQSAASSRGESKSSRADDGEDSTDKASAAQSKPRKPAQLALSRPRTNLAAVASAQLVAPSIFDGITPPIGSVSDRLAAGGPEAPGIVQPESQPGLRTSALQAAVLEQRVAPVYPSIAMASRVEGDVLVNATIGTDGVPRNLKVIRGDQRLIPAALSAIGQWRYRPATLGGRPIETQIVVTITFQLK
jgi:TonB family protein